MNRDEARQILSAELRKFRESAYADLIAKLGNQGCWEVVGPSGSAYQIEVDIFWDNPRAKSGNIRVIGSVDNGGLSAFKPLSEDFIMTPDGQFIGG